MTRILIAAMVLVSSVAFAENTKVVVVSPFHPISRPSFVITPGCNDLNPTWPEWSIHNIGGDMRQAGDYSIIRTDTGEVYVNERGGFFIYKGGTVIIGHWLLSSHVYTLLVTYGGRTQSSTVDCSHK